ncbi:MAG: proton-conducting transporter membrane subunit, partial [Acidimicrobiia bacterium]
VSMYAVTLVGAFAIVSVVSRPTPRRSDLDGWSGLSRRSPELAWSMLVLLLAMGGIPFTAGFVAKVSVFSVAADAGYLWLTILALLTTVVGLYVYFRIAAKMFFAAPGDAAPSDDAPGDDAPALSLSVAVRLVVAVAVVAQIVVGVDPWPLLDLAREALPL